MSESITHNQKLDKDCAKSIVEQLVSLNIPRSEIARRCGVNQSRINGWENGEKAGSENLQKLRALLNLRLPNHKAETFQVSKCVRLALTKDDLDLFLVKQMKAFIGELPSLPFELREKFDSAESLESLNEAIATQYHLYVCKEVDSDLYFTKRQEHVFNQMAPYVKPFSVLPSSYQDTMHSVLEQLKKAIQEAEEQIESKTHRELKNKEVFKSTIEYSVSNCFQRNFAFHSKPNENLEIIKQELLDSLERAIQDFNHTGTYFTHPLAELVSIMERVAQFLDDSQFGPKYGTLRLESRDTYFSDSIKKPEGFIEFEGIEFAIDSAKKLQGNFEKFIEEQQERYSALFKLKEKELGLCSKLDSDKIFHQKACEALASGKELGVQDARLSNLAVFADSILKCDKLPIALNGKKHELELLNGLKEMLNDLTPEPIIHPVQIGGQLVFSKERENKGKTLIYSLNNNDLVLLQEASICDQQILTIQPKLAAEELLTHIDADIKESAKQSLLEHGYMFSDVEVLG
ncbi:TPA: helix-turn-helix transcriptional regulator [Vibrio parahaemolyticus]|nr:helix-turn-helix transcriptional regulator [Vibrio parahaemolyticus]HCG8607150.1 helix-turn-helix transcriptional regulator [Vibrio parahaemolyticus]HCG9468986.1 helix-turn-helix transcriptional regulator [Vibrio parahaemolyticus]HCH4276376.1 helix-turn-helix transcriptional regulator [Vibrio parahaemolyticus]